MMTLMATQEQKLRFSLSTMLISIAFVSAILGAFCRGNYLMGPGAGFIYAFVAFLIVLLTISSLNTKPLPRFRIASLLVFAVFVGFAFSFPTYFNSDFQYQINRQHEERSAREELNSILSDDPAFSELDVATYHRKILCVEIHGTVPTKEDLDRLMKTVTNQCDFIEHSYVDWRVSVGR
jgi:hypothetical protein